MAGQGIKASGILLARFASRSGYNIFTHVEYPSIIRGGHNVMQVNISKGNVAATQSKIDFLIALNQETIDKHLEELTPGAGLLFDSDKKLNTDNVPETVHLCPIPLAQFAKEAGGSDILINTVALGAVVGIMGGDLNIMFKLIEDEFGDKGEKIVASDKKAAQLGYDFALKNFGHKFTNPLEPAEKGEHKMVLNGNEAAALGAIAAGMQFAAIYPMSPISNILHVLARHQEEFNYIYKQPEDEIAAMNMAIGAAFAGARSMVATSGGGFSLMAETYGLAGITETPLVIIEGMRGAPATGLPTWSEQSDLRLVLHAHQGDFPRIVLTPGDTKEVFYTTMQAFNLAEKYQTTVVVLIDKDLCESDQNYPYFDYSDYKIDRGKFTMEPTPNYKRYADSEDGISVRSAAGVGNFFIANSDEHDEYGYSSEEIDNRNTQMRKRMRKLETCAREDMEEPVLHGPENADITIISWGSTKGAILQAIEKYDNVNFIQVKWMNPFPTQALTRMLEKAKYTISAELNYGAHFTGLLREKTGFVVDDTLLKYDGRPFYPKEIQNKIEEVLKKGVSS